MPKSIRESDTSNSAVRRILSIALSAAAVVAAMLGLTVIDASAGEVCAVDCPDTCDSIDPTCPGEDDEIADDTGGIPTTTLPTDWDPGSGSGSTTQPPPEAVDPDLRDALSKIDSHLLEALEDCGWETEVLVYEGDESWIGWAQVEGGRTIYIISIPSSTPGTFEQAVASGVADAIDHEFLTDWDRMTWSAARGIDTGTPDQNLRARQWPGTEDFKMAFQHRMLGYTNAGFAPLTQHQEDTLDKMLRDIHDDEFDCRTLNG